MAMPHELFVIHDTLERVQDVYRKGVNDLRDCFADSPRLIVTPSNRCDEGCCHCVSDSKPFAGVMSYEKFRNISPDFFQVFSAADFGRKGNPLSYLSDSHDLADMINVLYKNRIRNFTIAAAIHNRKSSIKRLRLFRQEKEITIETMLTYHHYSENLDTLKLANDFNTAIRNYMGFSDNILISQLADNAKRKEVEGTFNRNRDIIFAGIDLKGGPLKYHASYKGHSAAITIPETDTRVYPLGRFRRYLEKTGSLQQYEKDFEESMGDYICPDLIKWPGIIIEPNGDLNMCSSFEAISCRKAVVSNIFEKPYNEVEQDLLGFHKKELEWFVRNIDGIIDGKVSTCRLKNGMQ